MKPVTILNTSILTSYGVFCYTRVTLEQAKEMLNDGYVSAVGHQATADLLTTLLGVPIEMNRIKYKQKPGDIALVFRLNGRPEEGKILTIPEIEKIGYEFGELAMSIRG